MSFPSLHMCNDKFPVTVQMSVSWSCHLKQVWDCPWRDGGRGRDFSGKNKAGRAERAVASQLAHGTIMASELMTRGVTISLWRKRSQTGWSLFVIESWPYLGNLHYEFWSLDSLDRTNICFWAEGGGWAFVVEGCLGSDKHCLFADNVTNSMYFAL